ncbi:MAG: hypothetical protein AABW56_02580, partial [Nanoarchaeota archaeon]
MQENKVNWKYIKSLIGVILTSSTELMGIFAIYFIDLARAMLNRSKNILVSGKINLKSIIVGLLVLITIGSVFSVIINAADPGHGANVIGQGTFE